MDSLISPKYQMKLVTSVHDTIRDEYKSYKEVDFYIDKWYEGDEWNNNWENFHVFRKEHGEIDLLSTLHSMSGSDLLKIAIDLGVDTPDFIPSIPTFKNELKTNFKTAHVTFTKAYKQIEIDPSLAIGLANSALESVIKEMLKDKRISSKVKGTETLYKLTSIILKELNLLNKEFPTEIRTIGSSLLVINQSIEKLRSEKTDFHGKTADDYLITDAIYTYFIINSVSTIGLFLSSYFKTMFLKPESQIEDHDDLPF